MAERVSVHAAPADRYTSQEYLERELQTVFHETWIVWARESDVARPGDCLPLDEIGQSVLLARGEDGVARVFRNACRHRGTRLLSRRGRLHELRCPYHGWCYSMDGRLTKVPREHEFKSLDKSAHGLLPVRTESLGGFVFATFDERAPRLPDYLGRIADDLAPFQLEKMRPLRRTTWTLPCNWKAFLDNQGESYHVSAVHPAFSMILQPRESLEQVGDHHVRTIAMRESRWRRALDRVTSPRDVTLSPERQGAYSRFLIFPNTLISATPLHLTVHRVFPVTADTCRIHYEFHIREDASVLARLRGQATLLASLWIMREDLSVLAAFQRGASSGLRPVALHPSELALKHFHRSVERFTGAAARSP
jgi:Rieske 2Fe-2S family protein